METYDPIIRAKVNLVDLGGKTLPVLVPVTAWVSGAIPFAALLIVLSRLGVLSLVTVFLALVAAAAVGKWVARETGGDHRLRDLALTGWCEARSTYRRWKATR